jgi:hypothetical protein
VGKRGIFGFFQKTLKKGLTFGRKPPIISLARRASQKVAREFEKMAA